MLAACAHTPPDTVVPAGSVRPGRAALPLAPGGGPSAAGVTRIALEDGMELVCVPAGTFLMGASDADSDASPDENPPREVYLDEYWIDRTEVTNAMFGRFVEATGHETTAEREGSAWVYDGDGDWGEVKGAYWRRPEGGGSAVGERMDHPVVQVSWHDAKEYCKWTGRRLPTEAQWEKAARGTEGRRYPWGDAAPAGHLLNFADKRLAVDWADRGVDDGYERTAPVGSYPAGASPYGALDMAGNVWEWVEDWYDGEYYHRNVWEWVENWYDGEYYRRAPGENPPGPSGGTYRVLRGGSWNDSARRVRSSNRFDSHPGGRNDNLGFRCALP